MGSAFTAPARNGEKPRKVNFRGSLPLVADFASYARMASIRRATTLMILIIGLMAGPAVSL